MKTLDEVVEMAEHCWKPMPKGTCINCPSGERAGKCNILAQALYYLKEYKDKTHRLDIDIAEHHRTFLQLGVEIARYQEAVRNCEEAENKFRKMEDELNDIRREHIEQMKNPPLTWEQLKQMEGKPVWIEHLETETPHGEWTIVQTPAVFGDVYVVTRCRDRYVLYEKDLGKTWQAFRRER